MVEQQPSKLNTRVRFPSPAPIEVAPRQRSRAGENVMIVATTNEISGYRIVRHLGTVRGITVRSRSVIGNFVGGIQSIFGGKLGAFVQLAETARQEAYDHMCEHASQGGANAVVCMRYDANEIMD